jgi:hypothetical protein
VSKENNNYDVWVKESGAYVPIDNLTDVPFFEHSVVIPVVNWGDPTGTASGTSRWKYFRHNACGGDLYLRDHEADYGYEPGDDEYVDYEGPYWKSPDIWASCKSKEECPRIRLGPPTAEEPDLFPNAASDRNYVYVRINNKDMFPGHGWFFVYWAKPATGLGWGDPYSYYPGTAEAKNHWIEYYPEDYGDCPAGVMYGDIVEYYDPYPKYVSGPHEINPDDIPYTGEVEVYDIPWDNMPDPGEFDCYGASSGHFCLMARIVTSNTYPYGMAYAEKKSHRRNVKYNNNIAWRNIKICSMEPCMYYSDAILIRNISQEPAELDIEFLVEPWVFNSFEIWIDLSSFDNNPLPVYTGLIATADPYFLQMSEPIARLENIPMDADEHRAIGVSFEHLCQFQYATDPEFVLDVIQYTNDSTIPDGGIQFQVYVAPPSSTFRVEKVEEVLQGHFAEVSIFTENGDIEMGGFDFVISYDAGPLAFIEAEPGQFTEDCDWEYFTYRFGVDGNCGDDCPSGLLRIIAIAETNNGPYHPSCYGPSDQDPHELAKLTFFVTNDRTYDCQYVPINFFWGDCGDNSISSVSGDSLFIDRRIYDFEGNIIWDENDDDQFPEDARIPFVGAPDYCLNTDPEKPSAIRSLGFINGGIDIICSDSIDVRGDINVNGVENEIADAVMFTNYFINGLSAFGDHVEASIAASDVNADGIALSVADLVYLVRVITGDAPPYPKVTPFVMETSVSTMINHSAAAVTTNSSANIGVGYFVFEYSGLEVGEPQLINGASDMTLKYSDDGGVLKVLVYSMEKGMMIPAGTENIFAVPITGDGSIELREAELSDYYGNLLEVTIDKKAALPNAFALHQNYPNPFNLSTTIIYELPEATDVTIEVFNVLGQKVTTLFDGRETAGVHSISWEGTDESGTIVSSGVYLYRISTTGFTAEKKMVLMK